MDTMRAKEGLKAAPNAQQDLNAQQIRKINLPRDAKLDIMLQFKALLHVFSAQLALNVLMLPVSRHHVKWENILH